MSAGEIKMFSLLQEGYSYKIILKNNEYTNGNPYDFCNMISRPYTARALG
jgi:hypothetical protein